MVTSTWNGGRGRSAFRRLASPGAFVAEEGPAHAVVGEDLLDAPAARLRVGAAALRLASDRLRVLRDAVLVGALARVDGGDHGVTSRMILSSMSTRTTVSPQITAVQTRSQMLRHAMRFPSASAEVVCAWTASFRRRSSRSKAWCPPGAHD
jgi:hypothetical protein